MTPAEAKDILATALRELGKPYRENLRWHLEHGTVPLCGPRAKLDWVRDGKP